MTDLPSALTHLGIALIVIGTLTTLGALLQAYCGAGKQVRAAARRIVVGRKLRERELREVAAIQAPDHPTLVKLHEDAYEESRLRYEAEGIKRPGIDDIHELHQWETVRIARELLDGAKFALIVAGAGLVFASAGSILTALPTLL